MRTTQQQCPSHRTIINYNIVSECLNRIPTAILHIILPMSYIIIY